MDIETDSSERSHEPPVPDPAQGKLPPEIATLLIAIGVVGIPLPGPGIPFILAGGLALWPKTFRPLDSRFRTSCPKSHQQVANILKRFEEDLKRRYPTARP